MPSEHPPDNPLDSYEEALRLLYTPWGSNKSTNIQEGIFVQWIEVTYESGHYGCSSRTSRHHITSAVLQKLKDDGIFKSWVKIERHIRREKLYEVMDGLKMFAKPEVTDGNESPKTLS